jgi:hypothetical protein
MTLPAIPQEQEISANLKRRSYKAILEFSARYPLLTSAEIAVMIGASSAWVKSVMKSDAFLAQRAQKIQDLHGPRLAEIQAKMETTMSMALDAIAQRIANPNAEVSEETLLKCFTILRDSILPPTPNASANPGPNQPGTGAVAVHFHGVTPEDLVRARDAAMNRNRMITLEPQSHDTSEKFDEDGLPQIARVRSNEGLD